jgi:signal transduction histidine kinase
MDDMSAPTTPDPVPRAASGPAGTAVPLRVPDPPTVHAWERLLVGWHVAFWLLAGLATVWVAATTQLTPGERGVGFGLLAVLAAAYALLIMRPGDTCATWRGPTYLTIAVVVVGAGCALDPTLTMLLFIVFAQVWMFSGRRRNAVGFAVLLTLSVLAGFLSHFGWSRPVLRELAPQLGISLAFSLLLGFWISRIIDQSQERAGLITELRAARDDLARAEHARGALAERERMAREIHDTLAQGFTSVVMLAQAAAARLHRDPEGAAQQLDTIEDVARANLAEARALVAALAPVDLDGRTFTDAVRRLAARFGRETGTTVEVDAPDAVANVGRDGEVVLLRAVQESLANVRRHAGAGRVVIRLVPDDGVLRLEVHDDGVGFEPAGSDGFGLAAMRGRAGEVGGDVAVTSAPGAGTEVVVQVPTREAAAEPVASKPVASKPVASKPVASKPVASGPVASGPVASGPVASKPAAAEPAAAEANGRRGSQHEATEGAPA